MPYKDYEKQKQNSRENYYKNKEKKLEQAKEYYFNNWEKKQIQRSEWRKRNPEKVKEAMKKYFQSEKGKITRKKAMLKQKLKYPEKIICRNLTHTAIKNGTLKKKPCEICGSKNAHAHHYKGYSKENYLSIKWLCLTHHHNEHFNKTSR